MDAQPERDDREWPLKGRPDDQWLRAAAESQQTGSHAGSQAGSQETRQIGRAYLVGAGPGEPGSITLRALECLSLADVVLYDYLVNPSLLRWATKSGVELISLGGHGGQGRQLPQAEVIEIMLRETRRGRQVVRLKSGDPVIFARASEELDALLAAGIPFEIVPGVTSALAAGSYAGIPLTHRRHASAVALVTGHQAQASPTGLSGDAETGVGEGSEAAGPASQALDWQALAGFPGTLVIYMGTTQVEQWAGQLLHFGKDPATPVAAVRRCGFHDQTVLRTTLGSLVETVTQPKRIRPPVVFVVGSVVDEAQARDWFSHRPLCGQSVLVTRPADQSGSLLRRLECLGAQVYQWSAIQIAPLQDTTELDRAIAEVPSFDWLVFNSVNGVRSFFQRLWSAGHDARWLAKCRLACIGQKTAESLAGYGLRGDLVPDRFDADHLADDLVPLVDGRTCLVVRASRGREDLAHRLSSAGADVQQVVAYRNLDTEEVPQEIRSAMEQGKIDWVTCTSSAIASNLVRCFGTALKQTRLASLSPITSGTLQRLGFPPAVEAVHYTTEGLLDAILRSK